MEWCESNGIEMAKIFISHSHQTRSLVAETPIERDDVLLSIPAHSIVAVSSDRNSDPPPFLRLRFLDPHFWEDQSWDIRLAVLLLDHYLAKGDSPWYPYIKSLPKRPHSVICALVSAQRAPKARTQLQALDLLDSADSYAAYVVAQYNSFSKALRNSMGIDVKLFCWAAAIAQSRAFAVPSLHYQAFDGLPSMPQYFALFPALDCGNHSAHARSELRFDENTQSYVVISGKSYAKQQQVYLNYGDRTPDELALFYGFVEGFSPNSSTQVGSEIVWECQDDNDALLKRKVQLLEHLDLAHADDSFRISLHEVDPRLMHALRICTANEEELVKLHTMDELKPVGLDSEIRAWNALTTHCEWLIQNINPQFEQEFENLPKPSAASDFIPFSAAFDWGGDNNCRAHALFRFERNRILKQTIKRTHQFAHMSRKLGRLIDPALLKGATNSILPSSRPRTFLSNNYFRSPGVKL